MKSLAYFQGTGRRKTAIARVRLVPGEGAVVVNGKPLVALSDGGGGAALGVLLDVLYVLFDLLLVGRDILLVGFDIFLLGRKLHIV